MIAIVVFIAFVVLGDGVAIGIASVVERFSPSASLLVFLGLFVIVFWLAWLLAVRVTERYFVRQP
jgi:hypothetical protein